MNLFAGAQSTKITIDRAIYAGTVKAADDGIEFKNERDSCRTLVIAKDYEINRKENYILKIQGQLATANRETVKQTEENKKLEEKLKGKDAEVDFYKRDAKKQKRKTVFVGMLGILTTAASFYIGIK